MTDIKAGGKVAVVTGGNRGMGLEVCRQLVAQGWHVVLAGRSLEKATAAADSLAADVAEGGGVTPAQLDVGNAAEATALAAMVDERFGRLDSLVNNAGAMFEQGWPSAAEANMEHVDQTLQTNTVGALRVTQAFIPILRRDGGATIVNVSSGMGGIAEMEGGHIGYRMSKAALNALTRVLHAELHADGVRTNSVCPGFVRTGFSALNADAPLSPQEGASGIVWAATLPADGPSGGFFRQGEPVAW